MRRRATPRGRWSRRPVSASAPLGITREQAFVLGLQRTAGNHAVNGFLGRCASGAPGGSRVLARRDETTPDVDVVVVPEEERKGMDLPKVSPQGADPKLNEAYVDNRINAAAWNIHLGGPLLWLKGLENFKEPWTAMVGLGGAVWVPDDQFVWSTSHRPATVDQAVYSDRAAAVSHLPAGPYAVETMPVGYYRTRGGLIAPTVFSPQTTPNIILTVIGAMKIYGKEVSDELTVVALGLAAGLLLNFVVGASKIFRGRSAGSSPKLDPAAVDEAGATVRTKNAPKPSAPDAPPSPAATEAPPAPKAAEPATPTTEAPNASEAPKAVEKPLPPVQHAGEVRISLAESRPAPGSGYGKGLGERLKAQGKTGPAAFKPIMEDLSGQPGVANIDKADAAKAAVDASLPTFGCGPVVKMGDNYVVTSRVAFDKAPAIVVKPDGTLVRGMVDIVQDGIYWRLSNLRY